MTSALREPTPRESARITRERERFADRPDVVAEFEADYARQLSRPAPPECPAWCDEPNHDGFADMAGDDVGRQILSHSLTISDGVFIVVDEFRESDDSITRESPFIHTYSDGQNMSADQAEAHGLALVKAAAKLREIVGAT